MSDSLRPHRQQHTRLTCPSLTSRVCSNSCPLSQWCHPTMSSSVTHFPCNQSFPESGSFPMSQLFASGGQSNGASASTSVLPMNIQGWSCSPRDSQESSPAPQFESINSSVLSLLCNPTLTSIHDYWKNHSHWLDGPLREKWCLCFYDVSRFVIAFLPRSKHLFNFMAAITICSDFGAPENKNLSLFPLFPHLPAMKWWDQRLWY